MNVAAPPFQRHFLALRLDAVAARRLGAVDVPDDARRIPAEDLHVTLAFLDTLDARGEATARAVMAEAVQGVPSPRVRLDRLEAWREALVLCAVPSPASETLAGLAARLAEGLARRGLRVDTLPFRTHVTVARLRRRVAVPARLLHPPITWRAGELVMLASRPGPPAVPRYHRLHEVPFAGALDIGVRDR